MLICGPPKKIFLAPRPKFKYKTHQIWATFSWKSCFFIIFFLEKNKKNLDFWPKIKIFVPSPWPGALAIYSPVDRPAMGGIFTPWTKFDQGGGTKLIWGGFFGDASGARSEGPPIRDNPDPFMWFIAILLPISFNNRNYSWLNFSEVAMIYPCIHTTKMLRQISHLGWDKKSKYKDKQNSMKIFFEAYFYA